MYPHSFILHSSMSSHTPSISLPPLSRSQGVKIVTDERATSAASSVGDDTGAIADLIARLTAGTKDLPAGFRMTAVQFEKVSELAVRDGWRCGGGEMGEEGGYRYGFG